MWKFLCLFKMGRSERLDMALLFCCHFIMMLGSEGLPVTPSLASWPKWLCCSPAGLWEMTLDSYMGRASFMLVWTSLDGADRAFVEFICSITTEETQNVYKKILYTSSGNHLFTAKQRSFNITIEPGLQRWLHFLIVLCMYLPARRWRSEAVVIHGDLTSTITTHNIIKKCIRKDSKQYCILISGHTYSQWVP